MATTHGVPGLQAALDTSRLGARARARADVADRLRTSALELFLARGFDEVTVDEIAEGAGVVARTFFRHFPSKETVIVDIIDHTNRRLVELVGSVPSSSSVIELLRTAIGLWFTEFRQLWPIVSQLTARSDSALAATTAQESKWTHRLGDAVWARFPHLDEAGARVWGLLALDLVRLTHEIADQNDVEHVDAVPQAFDVFVGQLRHI